MYNYEYNIGIELVYLFYNIIQFLIYILLNLIL